VEELNLSSKDLKALAKARRPWYMKKRFWALGVVGVMILGGVASSGGDDPKKVGEVTQSGTVDSPSTTASPADAPSPTVTTAKASVTTVTTGKASYKAGDILKANDLEAVALSLNPNWVPDNEFMEAEAGNKFVAVEFQLKNTGDKSESISTLLQFALKDSSNGQYDVSFYGPEPQFPDGELAAADTVRGFVTFEVPQAASGFRFIFDAKFFGGGQMVWNL
jgi:hypothetical protein